MSNSVCSSYVTSTASRGLRSPAAMRCRAYKLVSIYNGAKNATTDLCNDLGIWVQLKQTSGKFGGSSVVVGLREDVDGATQCDLHVRRLEGAVGEISRKLKAPRNVIRILLGDSAPFKLDGNSKKVFASSGDSVSPLKV